MSDISDGLTADLGHLAAASDVGMQLDRVPVADGATLEEALGGGEDFVLAFCAPDEAAVLDAFAGLPTPARIGTCTGDTGRLALNGQPLEPAGWEHQW
jgi:thiamine-monophosphate kinase